MESSAPPNPSTPGTVATVKWFNPAKGFGFVAPSDESLDAFLHVSVVHKAGFKTLRQGATIVCTIVDGPKGPQVSEISDVDNSTVVDDLPEAVGNTLIGEVKFFTGDKGYGFAVTEESSEDVFIGIAALQRSNLDRLESNQRVRMEVRDGPKGPTAVKVEILDNYDADQSLPPGDSENTDETNQSAEESNVDETTAENT